MESISISRSNRVVGNPEKDFKIYIEDYVKSYIARLSQDMSDKGNIEILYGKYRTDGRRMEIDVNGAAALTDIYQTGSGEGRLSREIEVLNVEFFPELEPVGWFYNPVKGRRIDYSMMMDIHEELLGERVGLLLLPNPESTDPDVFSYSQDGFRKHQGYIVYYEKNTEMQEYLLAHTRRNEPQSKIKDLTAPLLDKFSDGKGFRQRIISIPSKVKQFSGDTLKKNKEKEGYTAKRQSLAMYFIVTGLLAVVFTGLVISYRTYYLTDIGSALEYIKEFVRYYLSKSR